MSEIKFSYNKNIFRSRKVVVLIFIIILILNFLWIINLSFELFMPVLNKFKILIFMYIFFIIINIIVLYFILHPIRANILWVRSNKQPVKGYKQPERGIKYSYLSIKEEKYLVDADDENRKAVKIIIVIISPFIFLSLLAIFFRSAEMLSMQITIILILTNVLVMVYGFNFMHK